MAEIAFEALVRVTIAIVVLVILINFLQVLGEVGEQRIRNYFQPADNILDASEFSTQMFEQILNHCFEKYKAKLIKERELCVILKNVDLQKLDVAVNNTGFVETSENLGKHVFVYVLPDGSILLE